MSSPRYTRWCSYGVVFCLLGDHVCGRPGLSVYYLVNVRVIYAHRDATFLKPFIQEHGTVAAERFEGLWVFARLTAGRFHQLKVKQLQ